MKLIAEIDESEKNEAITKRLKQLITENYREPDVDGKLEDCTEEVLQELIQQDESDDEEQGHELNWNLNLPTRMYTPSRRKTEIKVFI